MKIKKHLSSILILLLIFSFANFNVFAAENEGGFNEYGVKKALKSSPSIDDRWVKLKEKNNVYLDKAWTIKFSKEVTLDNLDAVIIEKDSKLIPVRVELKENTAIVTPVNDYEANEKYCLKILFRNGKKYYMNFNSCNSTEVHQGDERAEDIHYQSWKDVSSKALKEPQYKYGIYVSRSMAVKHPEIYLQSDRLFYDKIMKNEAGMKALFENKTKDYNERRKFTKSNTSMESLLWSDIDVKDFTKTIYKEFYLNQPFFDYIDIRMYGIATALQSTDMKMVPLNMAEIIYFQEKIIKKQNPYILMTEDGNAYVWSENKLLKCNGDETSKISEKVVLIFNEDYAWYPLMERNDTGKDSVLKSLVKKYTHKDYELPKLRHMEEEVVKILRKSTEIKNKEEEIKIKYYSSKIYTAYLRRGEFKDREVFTVYDKENNSMRELDTGFVYFVAAKNANYLSPVTAYYASRAKELENESLNTITNAIINDFHKKTQTGSVEGSTISALKLWTESELVYINIDDTWLTKASNCMYSASNASAIFELANIKDMEIIGVSMGYEDLNGGHIYLALYKGEEKRLLENFHPHGENDNGLINFGTSIFRGFISDQDWVMFLDDVNPNNMKTCTTKDEKWILSILNMVHEKSEAKAIMVDKINAGTGNLKGIDIKDFIKKINIDDLVIYFY